VSFELVVGVDLGSCLMTVLGGVTGEGVDAIGVNALGVDALGLEDAIGELFAARSGRPGR
jgi:hypothetical protein